MLTRDPEVDPLTGRARTISGDYLVSATEGWDEKMQPAVHFRFNSTGGELFREVTSRNLPEGAKPSQNIPRRFSQNTRTQKAFPVPQMPLEFDLLLLLAIIAPCSSTFLCSFRNSDARWS